MPTQHTSQGGSGYPPRSRSCHGNRHADCGHLLGVARRWDARPAVLLCLCTCHSGCALAGRLPLVTREVWQAQCICPGTDLAAGKLDEAERDAPDFGDFQRQWRERRERSARQSQQRRAARREAKREAFEAARAAGAGKSRAQIREIYVAELRARGLALPSDLVLDATADAIARNREKFSVVYSARVLAELSRDFKKLFSRHDPWSADS